MQQVTDDLDEVLEDVGDDFYAGEGPAPKAKPAKPPRSKEKFAMVPLRWRSSPDRARLGGLTEIA
jgi:hypothetical protein